jgi:hypothetical protein
VNPPYAMPTSNPTVFGMTQVLENIRKNIRYSLPINADICEKATKVCAEI